MSNDWNSTLLGDHVDLLTGYPFSSELYSESADGFRLLRGDNISQGHLVWTDAKIWPRSEVYGLDQYYLSEGDIVLAMDRTWVNAGLKLATVTSADVPCLLVQRVARMRGAEGLDTSFLRQTIGSHRFAEYVRSVQTATAVPHISTRQIREYPIALPPLVEQKGITAVLSTWDRATRQLADLIAAKLRFKQGLMRQLLTGKRRFPGFMGDWEPARIGAIASEVSERNGHESTIPVLSCTKYDGLVNSLEYFGKRVFSENTENYKVVRRNEFAYATNHIEEGSIGLLSDLEAGLVSPMYTVFRITGKVLPAFLYRLLKTETYRQIFESFTSASVNRRGSLRWKQFATIPLVLPCVQEQERITTALSVFDREIDLLRKQFDAIKQQKNGLMQKLLTGEVRVKNFQQLEKKGPKP